MKKLSKVLIIVFGSLAGFILLFLLGFRLYFRIPVSSYYKVSKKAFVIPDTNRNFVSQGLTYDEKAENFYLTGYMKDNSACPVYIVNKNTKKLIKTIKLSNPDNTPFVNHCGGLSLYQDNIYIAGGHDNCLYVFDKNEIDQAENKSSVTYKNIISLETEDDMIGVAFTTTDKDMLIAGEFYRLPQYPTSPKHEITTIDGKNNAIALAFTLSDNKAVPSYVYSLPENVQGMAFSDEKIYVSTSWGLSFSNILIYDRSKITSNGTMTVLDTEVPLYILDSSSLEKTIKTAPMSEEIELIDGKLYQVNESASNKYVFGKFTGGKYSYYSEF